MLQYIETTQVAIPGKQHKILLRIAQQEGQNFDDFILQLLQEGIERHQHAPPARTTTQKLKALEQVEEHRKAFLARRNNTPLTIDPVSFLDQIREEHDQHLINLWQSEPNHHD